MACMCGDYCCPSCGPAQGNWKCPICYEWASEGCIHIGKNGKLRARYEKQAAENDRLEREAEDKLYAELEDADRLVEEENRRLWSEK